MVVPRPATKSSHPDKDTAISSISSRRLLQEHVTIEQRRRQKDASDRLRADGSTLGTISA